MPFEFRRLKTRPIHTGLTTALLLLCIALSNDAMAVPQFSITLIAPGQPYSEANAINNSGRVVGGYGSSATSHRPFYFDSNTSTLVDINMGGRNFGIAVGVNDAGDVVGSVGFAATTENAFLLRNGSPTPTILTDPNMIRAQDLDESQGGPNQRIVVGYGQFGSHQQPAKYDEATNTMVNVNQLGGVGSNSHAITADGSTIVGAAVNALGIQRPFVYDVGTNVMTALDTVGGPAHLDGNANDITDSGLIVGNSEASDGNRHATLWVNGAPTDLGTLGASVSSAGGINEAGQIVGSVGPNINNLTRAFLYDSGVMYDLNALVLSSDPLFGLIVLIAATDINESGLIVGNGIYNGQQVAVLLTPDLAPPVNEPGTLGGVAFGIMLLLWRHRRLNR